MTHDARFSRSPSFGFFRAFAVVALGAGPALPAVRAPRRSARYPTVFVAIEDVDAVVGHELASK